jgi:preprotein translocase subunit YajC
MFTIPAFAETATTAADAATGTGSMITSLLPIFLILAVFFFLVIRPQNKRLQEHRNIISNLQKGDKVVTGGGLIATVKKTVGDDEVLLELATGVEVLAVRSTIMAVRSKANEKKE